MSLAMLVEEEVRRPMRPPEESVAEAVQRHPAAGVVPVRPDHDDDGPIPLICGVFTAGGAFAGVELCILLCANLDSASFFSARVCWELVGWGALSALGAGCVYLWLFHGLTKNLLSQATYALSVSAGAMIPFALHVLHAAVR